MKKKKKDEVIVLWSDSPCIKGARDIWARVKNNGLEVAEDRETPVLEKQWEKTTLYLKEQRGIRVHKKSQVGLKQEMNAEKRHSEYRVFC